MRVGTAITGRKPSEPEVQDIRPHPKQITPEQREALLGLLETIDLKDIEQRVAMMWGQFPYLHLPRTYGTDLLDIVQGQLEFPADPNEVYNWEWRKVQQYYVHLLIKDPGPKDSMTVRANVAGELRGRMADRAMLDRYIQKGFQHSASTREARPNIVVVKLKK